MTRFHQALLIVSTLAFCWLAMQAVHELGHVLFAWLSGGIVERVYLHPLAFSRTDLGANPHPLAVAWGGAVVGCLLPLLIWVVVRAVWRSQSYLAAFFARFCLIANGAYLVGGSFFGEGGGDDAGQILAKGGQQWQLIIFGVSAMAAGLYLCSGLGERFGLGPAGSQVDRRAAVVVAVAVVVIVGVELVFAC